MPNDVLNSFRTKYPQYANVDDVTLASGIVSKYPQYADHLKDVLPQPMSAHTTPKPTLGEEMLAPIKDADARYQQNIQDYRNAPDIGGKVAAMIGQVNAGLQQGYGYTGLPQADALLRKFKSPNPFAPSGKMLADVISAPAKALGWIGSNAVGGAFTLLPENLGTSPESAKKIKAEVEEAGGTAAQLFGPKLLGGVPEVAKSMIPEALPSKLIARAGKFTGTPEQVIKKSNIAAREGINPTKIQAFEKLNETIDQLDRDIGSVAKHTDVIKTDNMMKFIEPMINKIKDKKLLPAQAEAEIRGIVEDVYRQRGESMPADVAHQVKKEIYKENAAAYDAQAKTGKLPTLDVKTQMRIASGILDEWKSLYPETAPLLKRQGELLSIQKDVARSVRSEMVKSPLPNSLLLAISPKWWLTKMIATNRNLEYNLGRVLYKARGAQESINPFKPSGEQPYDRIVNPIVSEGGGRYKYTKGDYVFFDEPSGSTIAIPKTGITPDAVKARIKKYEADTKAPSPYPDIMKQLGKQ